MNQLIDETLNYSIVDNNGRIVMFGKTIVRPFLDQHLTLDTVPPDSDYYWANTHWEKIPPSPTPHHKFDYSVKQWIDPRTIKTEWPLVRVKRDRLLSKSDWTQLPDVPVKTKEAWAAYRQALRDITQQADPFAIVWPVAPA